MTPWLGILLIVVAGLLWSIIGGLFSYAAKRGLSATAFSFATSLCTTVLSWSLICNWQAVMQGNLPAVQTFVPVIALGGVLNWIGMLLIMAAMRRGHQAGSWTVSQSAMIVPFLAGVVLWRERPAFANLAGVVLILSAIALFGWRSARHEAGLRGQPWFLLALLAFGFIGMSQTLLTVPSHWPGWSDPGRLRVPLIGTAACLFLGIVCAWNHDWPRRRELAAGVACSLVGLVGTVSLFAGMDIMAPRHLVSLVYPLAVGTCIVGFSLYTRLWLKEELGRIGSAALILGLTGVLLMGLG